MNPIVAITQPEPAFCLTWVLNNVCNHSCRYCPDYLHEGKNHHWTWEQAEKFSLDLIARHERIELTITGGEPTMSPHLPKLINLFRDHGHRVGVNSNGVKRADYWQDNPPTYLCLSYHPNQADTDWAERALATQEFVPATTARIIADPRHWDLVQSTWAQLAGTSLALEVVKIQDWGAEVPRYSKEKLDWIETRPQQGTPTLEPQTGAEVHRLLKSPRQEFIDGVTANAMINLNYNKFYNWTCTIGQNSLFVQFDGSIRKGNCPQDGYIGWIHDYTPPQEPTKCQQLSCDCTTDILTPKWRIPVTAAKPRSGQNKIL